MENKALIVDSTVLPPTTTNSNNSFVPDAAPSTNCSSLSTSSSNNSLLNNEQWESLDALFSPRSVAVIGASTKPGKVGHDIFVNILKGGYQGVLYPVNPRATSVACVKAYPSVLDIPDPSNIDLSMIILPGTLALQAVEDSISKGVKAIVIVSAGFREVGGEGRLIEDKIVLKCKQAGVRLVGPNCLGVINPQASVQLNASFSNRMPKAGNISFISQSGALCTAVLDFAADLDFGFSKFISIGNKADVDELDLLQYFSRDPDTDVIMIYLEELRPRYGAPEFILAVKKITEHTPVLVIKSGRTSAGAIAAASHTGSLAGTEAVYDAIFKQAGILRVDSIVELFDYSNVFASMKFVDPISGRRVRKVLSGNRLAIVTNAGGPGIVATDMTVSSGLTLAKFQEETVETLASHLPSTANLHNPVDVIGDAAADRYENALSTVLRDNGVDACLVILTPQSMTNSLETAQAIVKVSKFSHKPVVCCFMGIVDVTAGVHYLQNNKIPCFKFPENAARSLGALNHYSSWRNRHHLAQFSLQFDQERATNIIGKCLDEGMTHLGELIGYQLLECYGFRTMPTKLATTPQEAVEYANEMGYPVVMKVASAQILHKSDAGGVIVKLKTSDEVRQAFDAITKNAVDYDASAVLDGVIVQKMAPKGEEVILGANRYPVFGPLLMFGIGGIFVEVFKDVEFKLAPILRNEAHRMIGSIKGYKLLRGFRGRPETDLQDLERCLVSLSEMVMNHPEISELDINPLRVLPKDQGTVVVDCRMILKKHD